ncbi:MAG: PilW family protein [Oceanicoccus sp.]
MNKSYSLKSVAGLSLVELMVSMVIALVVLAGVIQSFVASKKSFIQESEVAYIQENARFAVDLVTRDIRQAGNWGCSASGDIANALSGDLNGLVKSSAIEGFEGGISALPSYLTTADTNTDALIVRYGDTNSAQIVQQHNNSATPPSIITVNPHTYAAGEIMILSDANCDQAGIFAANGIGANTVSHNSDARNCARLLSGTFECGNCTSTSSCSSGSVGDALATGNAAQYSAGSTLLPFVANAYFIDESSFDNNLPALHRVSISGTAGGVPQIITEELVSGVEDMQILYGVDNDIVADGQANRYFTANQISPNDIATAATGNIGWDRVVSIRVQLVMRSRNIVLSNNNTTAYLDNTPADKYLRQIVSTTVQLRNAGL